MRRYSEVLIGIVKNDGVKFNCAVKNVDLDIKFYNVRRGFDMLLKNKVYKNVRFK